MSPRIYSPYVVREQVVTSIDHNGVSRDRLVIETSLGPGAVERSEMLLKIVSFLKDNPNFDGADIKYAKES